MVDRAATARLTACTHADCCCHGFCSSAAALSSPSVLYWLRVRPSDDSGEWFNICVLHQNRVSHSLHEKNFISAKQLPDFLDMVVWGHEHECLMDEDSEEGEFVIVQPGSSVATSLSQGEARDKSDRSRSRRCPPCSACSLHRSDLLLLSCLPARLLVSGTSPSSRSRGTSSASSRSATATDTACCQPLPVLCSAATDA